MTGETSLDALLRHMKPELDPEAYVFCSFGDRSLAELAALDPLGLFRESEGVTAILTAEEADRLGQGSSPCFRRITLTVHSSLEAVGLTAAISKALADAGISANVVAAFYHDHVFVPEHTAEAALGVLKGVSET
ncbi:ACT domain-containing protein [Roseibium sp. RKSG952]|uniref:ACT domain-containing protein n=1 Tax=Roseibium sp. RKSG952 TaxID=2529384 RepID=UPI0012BD33EB|nr:ACT domain-containing protein [Roseibium sp. RKSG952]MTH96338.1 ACT domain-containing protein [Roseibium sp. RKSG952]